MAAPLGDYFQYIYMTPELAMITFEKWNDILKQKDLPERFHYGSLLQQFAKGLAYANTNDLKQAHSSLNKIEKLMTEKSLTIVFVPFNAAINGATVAKNILKGTIAEKEKKIEQAIQYYQLAVATEDSMIYNEPRDWLTPARHYLGNTLLHAKKYKEAAKVFREDLKIHPKNFLSTKSLQVVTAITTGKLIK
jgi:tetratricopeptide (TPR) repeat protein